MKLEALKTDGKSQILAQEANIKEKLMEQEFQYNMQLKQMEGLISKDKDVKAGEYKEDRKDQRTRMQATQQSELIDQRNNNKPPKNFETENDTPGGFNLGAFSPK
jgi:hypothetical protein